VGSTPTENSHEQQQTMDSIVAIKVFTATRAADREALGGKLTGWLEAHPEFKVLKATVRQSSDASFHCLSIVLFLAAKGPAPAG
jgi:hypothetical protein